MAARKYSTFSPRLFALGISPVNWPVTSSASIVSVLTLPSFSAYHGADRHLQVISPALVHQNEQHDGKQDEQDPSENASPEAHTATVATWTAASRSRAGRSYAAEDGRDVVLTYL